jgi:chromosome segregation ATPase
MADALQVVTTVTINQEQFDLCKIPDETTKLVATKKGEVLKSLNLQELITGLQRSASLLYLAYNGVAGFGALRAATNSLQDDLGVLCRDAEMALDRFASKTGQVLGKLKDTFTWLSKGKEKLGLNFLGQCATTAKEMAQDAEALAKRFDELADRTMKVCGDTEKQQSATQKEKEELQQKLIELKASNAKAQKEADELAALHKKLYELYEEAKAKAEKAGDRAFGLAITSAIMRPIATGVGAFAGAFARTEMGMPPSLPSKPQPTKPATDDKDKSANKVAEAQSTAEAAASASSKANDDLTKAKQTQNQNDAAVKVASETLAEAKKKMEAEKDPTPAKKTELDKAVTEAQRILNEAKKLQEAAKTEVENKEKALTEAKRIAEEKKKLADQVAEGAQSAARALEAVADSTESASGDYMSLANSYEEEKRNYLTKWMDYKEKAAGKLADMEKYAIEMSTVASDADIKKTVIDSLIQAVKSFNEVSQILRRAAQFWYNMAEACQKLGTNSELQSTIAAYTESVPDAAERASMYLEEDFKRQVVEYMAGWKALQLICLDYSKAAAQTRDTIQRNISSSPSPEQSIKLVPELAKTLLVDTQRAQAEIKRELSISKAAA